MNFCFLMNVSQRILHHSRHVGLSIFDSSDANVDVGNINGNTCANTNKLFASTPKPAQTEKTTSQLILTNQNQQKSRDFNFEKLFFLWLSLSFRHARTVV
eukprot:Lithocolla_globosa_v1_NODE_1881_length_2277_cov_195.480648.p4 type:complete len:100 gc:universal NODE_1881_length_2277_cov_195.480648:252-551(+)